MNPSTLKERTTAEEYESARSLYRNGAVREMERRADRLVYSVAGPGCTVSVFPDGTFRCSCGAASVCRHAAAAMMDAVSSGAFRAMQDVQAGSRGEQLMAIMESALPRTACIRLEADLYIDDSGMRIGLRIGLDRLYVVPSIPLFLDAADCGQNVTFGKGFTYYAEWMRFESPAENLIGLIRQHCASLKQSGVHISTKDARCMPIPSATASKIWETLEGQPYRLFLGDTELAQNGISHEPLPLVFSLSDRTRSSINYHRLCLTASIEADIRPLMEDWSYVLVDRTVTRIAPAQQKVVRLCAADRETGQTFFLFESRQTGKVLGELSLWLARIGSLNIAPELESKLIRSPFHARIYLDRDGPDVVARTQFLYGKYSIDPFSSAEDTNPLLLRDTQKEQQITDILAAAGFRIHGERVYLHRQEDIFHFMTEGAAQLSLYAEILFSKEFRGMQPRRPHLRGVMRTSSGRLTLEITDDGTNVEELLPLMRALRDRASYYRYKSGAFILLDETENWQKLAEAVCEASEADDCGSLGLYRAAYLKSLITETDVPVSMDPETDQASRLEAADFDPPIACLRPYQKKGFEWICTLHALHMGGILADDMGLGKTVQAIAALLYHAERETTRLPSLVVAPTSLTYNWLNEIKRFAPDLSVTILNGPQPVRAELLKTIREGDAPDILITSYPLIRRDAEQISGIHFRFAVLDEAQHIKNAASAGAHAVKHIQADTRIALTGTPMENHAGELWSIFDFILPGYLPRPGVFMQRYGEGRNNDDLLKRIRPFLLRRLKKDVLDELPDKLERTVFTEMTPEQKRVYQAGLLRRREQVERLLSDRGWEKSRAEVLSAITEMRQICCHPGLCLPDYSGSSGKLETLMDLILPALQSGHRLLVFSQFTRMLRLIESRFHAEGIESLYLDGSTPADERLNLCADFNEGKGDVFLLSLKAGGTGLNLIGADMVIHYDPWWNPASEDQAVDRAHRIGQTRKVEVIRLLTHDSIEEKVVEMSAAKRRLFDQLITAGGGIPEKLTKEEILNLFHS